jgi:DNA-binding transcriptional LysR family regulator
MRADWLEDVLALLNKGGVTEAAQERNITQPAFSRRIKILEEVLGISLIDRSTKPSGPSQLLRGHEAELRRIAADLLRVLSDMRQQQTSGARQLVIVCQHAISTSLGADIVQLLAEPNRVHIRLRSANFEDCNALLMSRKAAISVTYMVRSEFRAASDRDAFLTEAVIGSDTLLPVCSASEAQKHIRRLEGGELRVIGYPSDSFLGLVLSRHAFSELSRTCDVSIVAEAGLTNAVMQLCLSGIATAWLPKALAGPALARGELADLSHVLGAIEMDMVASCWSSETSPVAKKAWSRLTATTASHPINAGGTP